MRRGVFGGSFDPVHYGHLLLAETVREAAGLDDLLWIPAAAPPHKQDRTITDGKRRLEMLELALSGHPSMRVSAVEIDRGGISYTVDTLQTLCAEQPADRWFLLMGGDSLVDLPQWHRPREICNLAIPLVVRRPGAPEPDWDALAELVSASRLDEIRAAQVETPLIDLSSSDLRARVAAKQSIRYRTPRAVEAFIAAHGLYRTVAGP